MSKTNKKENQSMVLANKLRRSQALLAAALLLLASLIPLMSRESAVAYGLLSQRKITVSDSSNGATDVTYQVSFNTATNNPNIQGLVVDFCDNSPIIGDQCTTAGLGTFDINEATLAVPAGSMSGITDWTINAASTSTRLVLTRPSATAIAANTNIAFDMGYTGNNDGVTNPDT